MALSFDGCYSHRQSFKKYLSAHKSFEFSAKQRGAALMNHVLHHIALFAKWACREIKFEWNCRETIETNNFRAN